MTNLKTKIKTPKLFKRGANYSFRYNEDGKNKWKSTGESDKTLAGGVAREFLASLVKGETPEKKENTPLQELQDTWTKKYSKYNDLSPRSKDYAETVFKAFKKWADKKGKTYIEQIDNSLAAEYDIVLWDSEITARTFNEHVWHLSRLFKFYNNINELPQKNPFNSDIVPRRKRKEFGIAKHKAFELDQVEKILTEAAKAGQDMLDLFVIVWQTGMRLKDAALLEWKSVRKDFIDIIPYKTQKNQTEARIPITSAADEVFSRRKKNKKGIYVITTIAEKYLDKPELVSQDTKRIIERALGKENTQAETGIHRKNKTGIYTIHSFRSTFMSLLAQEQVSTPDAMRILGWESEEMIKVYKEELEKAKGEADARTLKAVSKIREFKTDIPKADEKMPQPTKEALEDLITKYSNITIGRIYGISDRAIGKHLKKHGIIRDKRIESADVTDAEIRKIREKLKNAQDK